MDFVGVNKLNYNLPNLLRKLGYHPSKFNDSFIRLLGRENYPRFHLYIKHQGTSLNFSLHLDQKKASYQGQTAHSGDYDNSLVLEEKNRILSLLK